MENEKTTTALTEEMFINAGWRRSAKDPLNAFERVISVDDEGNPTEDDPDSDLGPMVLMFGNPGFNQQCFYITLGEGNVLITTCRTPEEMNKWAESIAMYMPAW